MTCAYWLCNIQVIIHIAYLTLFVIIIVIMRKRKFGKRIIYSLKTSLTVEVNIV